ncbi:transforming growth factor beta activator LRRC32-like [Cricetulus griseus]|uniref:Transforming growth factor beta activator LRRC32-like n=1 Tax=Cricetulus griseus TaxID=10029 RepID=A0A9J7K6C7_CRIGR|nr:transforming growth factor beta activator LRRC32-like [Cricetulus griseus]XP_035314766.1 transforming growth factor beta activator LRRC32-like [Cricetulus griseus]
MSHQILLLLAMLTLGLAISQHRDQMPCRTFPPVCRWEVELGGTSFPPSGRKQSSG